MDRILLIHIGLTVIIIFNFCALRELGRMDVRTYGRTQKPNFKIYDFHLGNPDNNNDDNCMVLNLSNGLWYSHNCYDILPYICDFSQTNCPTCPSCPQTTCPPCQSHCEISCLDGWVYNSKTGFCYKVKKFSLNITRPTKCTLPM